MSTLGLLRSRQTDGSDRPMPDANPTSSTHTKVASPLRTRGGRRANTWETLASSDCESPVDRADS